MTRTEQIAQELLDAVDRPDQVDAVLARHVGSKGPLYAALARATATLKEQLPGLAQKAKEAQDQCRTRQEQVKVFDREVASRRQQRGALAKEIVKTEAKLKENRDLLGQVARLKAQGFGPDELARLHDVLAQVAAAKGAAPEDGVAQFFQMVS